MMVEAVTKCLGHITSTLTPSSSSSSSAVGRQAGCFSVAMNKSSPQTTSFPSSNLLLRSSTTSAALNKLSPSNSYPSSYSHISLDRTGAGFFFLFGEQQQQQQQRGSLNGLLHPPQSRPPLPISAQISRGIRIGKAQRWWEKGLQPNMEEVDGPQDLVDSLLSAGDKLVVLDFFSPGCGGCKALHPKICQLAEMYPQVMFLEVNYEAHKSMCHSLHVHVLPFFRFYRGALGRLCSFSCTNATIKKFKDALAKYGADFCSLEPTRGLEDKELLALAANRDLSFNYVPKTPLAPKPEKKISLEEAPASSSSSYSSSKTESPLPLLPLPSHTVLHSNTTLISSSSGRHDSNDLHTLQPPSPTPLLFPVYMCLYVNDMTPFPHE